MRHPVDFEERFVFEILRKIKGLNPQDVIPQYHFIDFDGGNRYIDFCIKNEEKGYFLSIELDGRFKFQHDLLEKTLERQNALVAQVGTLVRYANSTWLNNPNRVINEIQTILSNQNRKYMSDKESRQRIQESLDGYQKKLQEVEAFNKLNNDEKKIKKFNYIYIFLLFIIMVIVGGIIFALNNKNSLGIERNNIINQVADSIASSSKPININPVSNGLPQGESDKDNSFIIQSSDILNYIDEYKKVCGHVVQLKEFSKGVYLNIGNSYPNQDLTIVAWSNGELSLGDLYQYVGNDICITGNIILYKGIPQIELKSLKQIN